MESTSFLTGNKHPVAIKSAPERNIEEESQLQQAHPVDRVARILMPAIFVVFNVSYACCEYPIQPGPFLSSGNVHFLFFAIGYSWEPG